MNLSNVSKHQIAEDKILSHAKMMCATFKVAEDLSLKLKVRYSNVKVMMLILTYNERYLVSSTEKIGEGITGHRERDAEEMAAISGDQGKSRTAR